MLRRVLPLLLASTTLLGLLLSSCADIDNNIPDTPATEDIQSEDIGCEMPETVYLPSADLKVMSINVYLNDPNPRAAGLTSIISDADPDSIGVQEFTGDWIHHFTERLPQYAHAGFAHDGGVDSKYVYANYIFYKKDKFNLIDEGILWLTDTPTVPSGNEVAIQRRTVCWAVLEDKETGFRYVHVNCHLESNSEEDRLMQMPIVRDLILNFESLGYPVFSTGDYNAREGSTVYNIMTAADSIHDPKFIAEKTMDLGSYNGFGGSDYINGKPIDFCFVTGDKMTVKEYEIIPTLYDGQYVSDHNAVLVSVTVESLPKQTDIIPNLPTDGITYELTSVRSYVIELNITQANELFHTHFYRIWAVDENGNEVASRSIQSRAVDSNVPETLKCTLTGLLPDTEYTVYIAPMTILGTYYNSVAFTVKTVPLD